MKVPEAKERTKKKSRKKISEFFNRFSMSVTRITGGVYAFIVAVVFVIGWAITGPLFHYSNSWQLVVNTASSIATFLMVFVIQHSQNKDTTAIQLKLDELIAASHANNKMISIEDLSDEELEVMRKFYSSLSPHGKKRGNVESDDPSNKSEKVEQTIEQKITIKTQPSTNP